MKTIIILIFLFSMTFILSGEEEEFNPDLNYSQVFFVTAVETKTELWQFSVTLRHNDEGWDHYANTWQVIHPETNEIIAEGILAHPHVHEQPFTRSKSNISIPGDLEFVIVRSACTNHGFEGKQVRLPLNKNSETEEYKVVIRQVTEE